MKDPHRDEATAAFRALGVCERNGTEPQTEEEKAAKITLSVLMGEGRTGAVDAVRYVYYDLPEKSYKGQVEGLVTQFCTDYFVSRWTAYTWLRISRQLYARVRYPSIE